MEDVTIKIPWNRNLGVAPADRWLIGWFEDESDDQTFWSPVKLKITSASIYPTGAALLAVAGDVGARVQGTAEFVWRYDEAPIPKGIHLVAWAYPPLGPPATCSGDGTSEVETEPCPFDHSACADHGMHTDKTLQVETFDPEDGGSPIFRIECMGCGAVGPPTESRDEAVRVWNARSTS